MHEAIGNAPADDELNIQPRAMPAQQPQGEEGSKVGYKCLRWKKEGYAVGMKKCVWVCRTCNALESRIRRMCEGKEIFKMWCNMDPAERQAWRAENGELVHAALKDQLSVTFTQKLVLAETEATGACGIFSFVRVQAKRVLAGMVGLDREDVRESRGDEWSKNLCDANSLGIE